jgi:D-proline reductase (dithiol) PrdB
MARLNTMPEPMRSHLADLPCPTFDTRPFDWRPRTSKPPILSRSWSGRM